MMCILKTRLLSYSLVLFLFGGMAISPNATFAKPVAVDQQLTQIVATQEMLQRKLAEALNALEQSRNEFSQSKGMLDETTYVNQQQASQLEQLSEEVRGLRDRVSLMSVQLDEILAGKGDPKLTEQQKQEATSYLLGMDAYNADKIVAAREVWQKFMQTYPKSRWIPNALYWVAESYFRTGDYTQAVQDYQTVVQKYPQSPWVKRAVFKQGVSFYHMKDYDSATVFFQKVAQSYPQTSEAWRSLEYQNRIKKLKEEQEKAAPQPGTTPQPEKPQVTS